MNLRALAVAVVAAVLAAACGQESATPPPLVTTTTLAEGDAPATTAAPAVGTSSGPVLDPAVITQVDCPPAIAGDAVACGVAEVPLDVTQGGDATATISIATVAGYDTGFRTPVAVMQGGPGGASSDLAAWFPQRAFTQVFVDQRGTGFAGPDFDCPEFDQVIPTLLESSAAEAGRLSTDAVVECAERFEGDTLLDSTTTQNHAFDVAQVMQGLGYDRWVAYGVSYGTTIGFELLRQPPPGLVGTVLDGVYPPELDVDSSVAATAELSIAAVAEACSGSARCTGYNDDVAGTLDRLIADLDESPRIVTLSPNESGYDRILDIRMDGGRLAEFVFLLLYSESLTRYLPAVLAGIEDGDEDAERWLARLGTRTMASAYAANNEGTYFAVQCHDRLPFTADERDVDGFGGAVTATPLRDICPAWDQDEAYEIVGTQVESDIPTLLLSGAFDPITPPELAEAAADGLPNSTVVTQDGRGHGIWAGDDCIASIVQQFVADPLRDLDTSCAAAGAPVDWAVP